MLITNIVGNRIDGSIYIGETAVANLNGYFVETMNDRGTIAKTIYDGRLFKENFDEVIQGLKEFDEKYEMYQKEYFDKMIIETIETQTFEEIPIRPIENE